MPRYRVVITKEHSSDFEINDTILCVEDDDRVRWHQGGFMTQLEEIVPVNFTRIKLIKDDSNGYKLFKRFFEAQLRQVPVTGIEPDFEGLGAFRHMQFRDLLEINYVS